MGETMIKRLSVRGAVRALRSKALSLVLSGALVCAMVPSSAFAVVQGDALTGQQAGVSMNAASEQEPSSAASDRRENDARKAAADAPSESSGKEGSEGQAAAEGAESADCTESDRNFDDPSAADAQAGVAIAEEEVTSRVASEAEATFEVDHQTSSASEEREEKLMLLAAQSGGSFILPASSAELDPGTYVVSANISMLTPLGFPGYTTNPSNPEGIGGKPGIPSAYVSNNAKLVVGRDGTRTLTVDLVNPVFTVQKVESSAGVTVEKVVTCPIEKKNGDDKYNKENLAPITTRISQLTLKLNNWSGSYQFAGWKVYATTLTRFFPDPGMPNIKSLDLSVDLARAQKQVEGDFQKTYSDPATGISVKVFADEGASTISQLQNANLEAMKVESGADHDAVSFGLAQHYSSMPRADHYRIDLVSGGQKVEFDGKTRAEVTISSSESGLTVYRFARGALSKIDSTFGSGTVGFSASGLGDFVFVGQSNPAPFPFSRTVYDSSIGASMTYSTDGSVEDQRIEPNDHSMSGIQKLEPYVTDLEGVFSSDAPPSSFLTKAEEAAENDGAAVPCRARGAYAMAMAVGRKAFRFEVGANLFYDHPGMPPYTFKAGINPLSAAVPVSSDDAVVYAVCGTAGGTAKAAKRLNARVAGGYAQISLNDAEVQIPNLTDSMWRAATGFDGVATGRLTPDSEVAYLVVVESAATPVDKPTAATGLVYNGKEQVGVKDGEGYDLVSSRATNVGTYTTIATLKKGYVWSDGTTDPVVLTWSIAAANKELSSGTYVVTANLSMPGEFNPLIKGLTVYANSPNNPFGPTIDENDPAEVVGEVPSKPLAMNARLIIAADGTRTLVLPIKNPIFTTQSLGTSDRLSNVRTERVKPTAGGGDWSGSYNKRVDRIHMMSAELPAGQAAGIATFDFKGSAMYAVPLDRELRPAGDTALQLTVDYDSLSRVSDSTDLPAFAKGGGNSGGTGNTDNTGGGGNAGSGSGSGYNAGGGSNGGGNGGSTGFDVGDRISTADGHLAAGTYTVSANIWVNKDEAGLPLSPHFTNASFPPSLSVFKNATLTVESDGHAYVKIPIVIQSRIMHVLSISGLNIVSSTRNGEGGLTSITVDLGILKDARTITKTATANIRLGSLASTIIGGPTERTWGVTFEVVFNGAPTQTGGVLPKAVLDIINAQGSDGTDASGREKADAAAADALAALDETLGAKQAWAHSLDGQVEESSSESSSAPDPLVVVPIVLAAIAALAGASAAVHARRKKGIS